MLKKNLKLKKTISELEDIPLKLSKIKHVWKKDGQLMHKTSVTYDIQNKTGTKDHILYDFLYTKF